MSGVVALPSVGATKREIFLLAGQSNMSGRGNLAHVRTLPHASRVKTYSNAGVWVDGREPVDSAIGQIDSVSVDSNANASPAMSFASSLAALRPGVEIGLVPCAKSGLAIASWARNLSRSTLYGSMIARAKEAAASGQLSGLLWFQGESDTASLTNVGAWATAFYSLVANVRSDLGIVALPVVATVLFQQPSGGGNPYWSNLQAVQRELSGEGIGVVSAEDLPGMVGEDIHLGAAEQIKLGRRYAVEMHRLLGS